MSGTFAVVIETSTPQASLARVGDAGAIEMRSFRSDRNHNAMLFEPLDELLGGLDHHGIGMVVVGSGPGSYSGTRVGIAAAQGIAIAACCPAVAVPSILAVPSAEGGRPCLAIGDARRGAYWSAMARDGELQSEPALCDAEGLAVAVAAAVDAGVSVISFEDPARFSLDGRLSGMVRLEFPDASRLWAAWCGASEASREKWSAAIPQPLYLKPPHITPGKAPCLVRKPFRC